MNPIFTDLIHIWISNQLTLGVEIGPILLFLIVVWLVISLVKLFKPVSRIFCHDIELNIGFGGIGNVKIKPNHEVVQIAHKAWTELITRKAGIQFETEYDVVSEVYDSWYVLFKEIRILIKDIPINQIQNKDTQKLVNVLVESLNKGLRPHLTKWQAKYRRWYEMEIKKEKNENKTPQEIQKGYPHFKDLTKDMIRVNKLMIEYADELKKLTI